jgi:Bacteriophage peptidoglycan hydrolase
LNFALVGFFHPWPESSLWPFFASGVGTLGLGGVGTILAGGLSGGVAAELFGGSFWDGARNGLIVAGLNHLGYRKFQDDIQAKREELALKAESYKNSNAWARASYKAKWRKAGDWGGENKSKGEKGIWKCSVFVDDVLHEVGLAPRSFLNAGDWGNPDLSVDGWEIVSNGGMQRGDIIAYKMALTGATGHVGVAVDKYNMIYVDATSVGYNRPWSTSHGVKLNWVIRRYVGEK